jgi:glycine cleavage system aminomethyltransferase T
MLMQNSTIAGLGIDSAVPMQYGGWRNEVMSWKDGCYLHAGLNPAPTFKVSGPDALRFFSENSVNSYAKFAIGSLKHCIMCNDDGLIMAHGVLLRTGEEEFISYFLAPYAAFRLFTGNYNAKGEFIQDGFILQIAGPRSLEALETAAKECLHDISFARHRNAKIAGIPVRVTRMGMAGTLAYEVHGNIADARVIYQAIWNAGQEFGMRKLGFYAYQLSHTEDGFPQGFMHFAYPWADDKDFMEWLGNPQMGGTLGGSVGYEMALRYRNPIELGWAKTVCWDHEFRGRAALEQELASPRRAVCTLEWDTDDVIDVYRSQFELGEYYPPMSASHFGQEHGNGALYADRVLKDGELVGISSGRNYSYYYRKMISLGCIDTALVKEGSELTVLWGNPGTRQKQIRVRVARFPYLDLPRNENIDVNTIPCRA